MSVLPVNQASQVNIVEPHNERKFSTMVPTIGRILNAFAVPAIALFALSNIPGAEGGPISYGVCVSACLSLATPVFMPACLVSCVGLSGPWCP